jgi:hypothetical protein
MKIAYVANHRHTLNDDEGAITYALRQLGHTVLEIPEFVGEHIPFQPGDYSPANDCDFVLCHHPWNYIDTLTATRPPKVFWTFDLTRHPLLPGWPIWEKLESLRAVCQLGFCTDGDYADTWPNVYHLFQGADSRIAGLRQIQDVENDLVVFAGYEEYLKSREDQLQSLEKHYGERFLRMTPQRHNTVYREEFAEVVSTSKVMVALKDPAKNNYWSNRVYVISGFGGVLIHPRCKMLEAQYREGEEILYYDNEADMFSKIDLCLDSPTLREHLRRGALQRTLNEHTYTHRCHTLVNTVVERLGL